MDQEKGKESKKSKQRSCRKSVQQLSVIAMNMIATEVCLAYTFLNFLQGTLQKHVLAHPFFFNLRQDRKKWFILVLFITLSCIKVHTYINNDFPQLPNLLASQQLLR